MRGINTVEVKLRGVNKRLISHWIFNETNCKHDFNYRVMPFHLTVELSKSFHNQNPRGFLMDFGENRLKVLHHTLETFRREFPFSEQVEISHLPVPQKRKESWRWISRQFVMCWERFSFWKSSVTPLVTRSYSCSPLLCLWAALFEPANQSAPGSVGGARVAPESVWKLETHSWQLHKKELKIQRNTQLKHTMSLYDVLWICLHWTTEIPWSMLDFYSSLMQPFKAHSVQQPNIFSFLVSLSMFSFLLFLFSVFTHVH